MGYLLVPVYEQINLKLLDSLVNALRLKERNEAVQIRWVDLVFEKMGVHVSDEHQNLTPQYMIRVTNLNLVIVHTVEILVVSLDHARILLDVLEDIFLKKMVCSCHLICISIKELHDQNTLLNLGRILTIEFLDNYAQWWINFLGHKLLDGVVAEKLEGHLQRSQAILKKCLVLLGLELLHFLDYL